MTACPRLASRVIRLSTSSVWLTPSAAVGSSMITSLASSITALATATDWRWPPDSDPTVCRTERTVVTARSLSVCLAVCSIEISSRSRYFSRSWPSIMFCTMSRLSHSARSWYTVAMPERGRVLRAPDVNGSPVPPDLAAARLPDARDALDQRALAGAVVADKRGHLTGGNIEIDVGQGVDGAEALSDAAQLQQRT